MIFFDLFNEDLSISAFQVSRLAKFGSETPVYATYARSAVDASALASSVYTTAPCTVLTDHTLVECPTEPGVGTDHLWTLHVGDQSSTAFSTTTSYTAPAISGLATANGLTELETAGSEVVTLTGTSFGPVNSINTVSATYSNAALSNLAGSTFTATGCTVTADTTIECNTAIGVGHSQAWTVTVGDQSSPASSDTTSYAAPRIECRYSGAGCTVRSGVSVASGGSDILPVTPATIATDGTTTITLTGTNFGPGSDYPTNVVTVAYSSETLSEDEHGFAGASHAATNCAVSDDGEFFLVKCGGTEEGVGTNLTFTITVGEQISSYDHGTLIGYDEPTIASLSSNIGDTLATTGGTVVTLTGDNFGPIGVRNNDQFISVTYVAADLSLFTSSELGYATKVATSCNVSVSHTAIECIAAEGVGGDLAFTAMVGFQASPASAARIGYTAPAITGLLGGTDVDLSNLLTVGGEVITVTGTDFGPLSPNPCAADSACNEVSMAYGLTMNALVGATAQNCTVTVSHTEMTCTSSAGVGKGLQVKATVGGQEGAAAPGNLNVSYHRPVINEMTPLAGTSLGGVLVTLTGEYFGNDDAAISVLMNGSYAGVVSTSETEIVARLNVSAPGVHIISVMVGNQDSAYKNANTTQYYAYTPISLTPEAGPFRGGTRVKLGGIALYNSPFIGMRVGYQDAEGNPDTAKGGYVSVPQGTFDSSDGSLDFVMPAISQSVSWFGTSVPVWMSLNNFSWSILEEGTYKAYAPATVTSISPASGPIKGGTVFNVTGVGFADTGAMVGRIRKHSNNSAFANSTLVDSSALAREALTEGYCEVLSSTLAQCTAPATTYSELVEFTFTEDDSNYNDAVLFSSLSGPEYFYYNTPTLYAGDTEASNVAAESHVTVRATVTMGGITLSGLGRDDYALFETKALALAQAMYSSTTSVTIESVRSGDYATSTSTSTGDVSVTSSGDLYSGDVTIVLQLGFASTVTDPSKSTSTFWTDKLNDFLVDASTIAGFGGAFASVTSASGSPSAPNSIPGPLAFSPVVYPQLGPSSTSCAHYCSEQSSLCQDSTNANFMGFCFGDGEGTEVTIAGLGLVPTKDSIRIKVGDAEYGSDAYNDVTVQVGDDGDTAIVFRVPDQSPGIRALEVALNGVDFTSKAIGFTHFELSDMYQIHSRPGSVYGPEHSTVSLQIFGDYFNYAPYSTSSELRDSHPILVEFGGVNNGTSVDESEVDSSECGDYYCTVTGYYCDKTISDTDLAVIEDADIACTTPTLFFNMPKMAVSSGASVSTYAGTWLMRFSLNGGISWGSTESQPSNYTIYKTPEVNAVSPRAGPTSGGTLMTASGDFFDTGYVDMLLENKQMDSCIFVDAATVRCTAAAYNKTLSPLTPSITTDTDDVTSKQYTAVTLSFIYYDEYRLDVATPNFGFSTGGTLVAVSGSNLEVVDDWSDYFEEATCRITKLTQDDGTSTLDNATGQLVSLYAQRPTSMLELPLYNSAYSNDTLGAVTVALELDSASLQSAGHLNADCSDLRLFYETPEPSSGYAGAAFGEACTQHADCTGTSGYAFCLRLVGSAAYGTCEACSSCGTCSDGVDGTCGACGSGPGDGIACDPAYSGSAVNKNAKAQFLDHYIEDCGNSDATLWVRFSSVAANTTNSSREATGATVDDSDKVFLLLGGDLSEAQRENRSFWDTTAPRLDAVFDFYDNFDSRDSSKWTYVGGNEVTPSFVEGPNAHPESVWNASSSDWDVVTAGPSHAYKNGRLKFSSSEATNATRFLHSAAPLASRAFGFRATSDSVQCNQLRFHVGPLGSTFEDAPLRFSHCTNAGGSTNVKCVNDECVPCARTGSATVEMTITVDWGRSGDVTFVDSVCGDVTASGAMEPAGDWFESRYLFVGAGPTTDSGNPSTYSAVVLDEIAVWPYAAVRLNMPLVNSAALRTDNIKTASSKLLVCDMPNSTEGVYEVAVALNGQQFTSMADTSQTYTAGSPLLSSLGLSVEFLDQSAVPEGSVAVSYGGGETLFALGEGLAKTPEGAVARFSNELGTKYVAGTLDADNTAVFMTTPSFFSEMPRRTDDLNYTSVSVSLNGQQWVDVTAAPLYADLDLNTPSICRAIEEDFDFIDNAGTMDPASDTLGAFGAHHSYWHSIVGGHTEASCYTDATTSLYKYQRLVMSGNSSSYRELRTTNFDTSLARGNDTVLSFNLTWLPDEPHTGADACGVKLSAVKLPVFLEASTDNGASWVALAAFGMGLDGDDEDGVRWETKGGTVIRSGAGVYSVNIGRFFDLIAPQLSLRWVQDLPNSIDPSARLDANSDPWALDSITFDLVPNVQPAMYVNDMLPRSGLLTGGTVVTLKGSFPKGNAPLVCKFTYEGDMTASGFDSAFRAWNGGAVASMVTTWVNESVVTCEVPPYYSDVESGERCTDANKKLCKDCCVLKVSLEACGTPVIFEEVDTYPQGASVTEQEYLLLSTDFVYYNQIEVTSFYPLTGAFSNEGSLTQLSESTSASTIFFSKDMRVRFTVDGAASTGSTTYEFGAAVNTGLGLLKDFPQVGTSYGEVGFPFGSDANSYRFQSLYLWNEISTLYDTSAEIKTLYDEDQAALVARCVSQGYYESLSPTGSALLDCDNLIGSDYEDYIGKVDRIQFKVKHAPTADLRNLRIAIDPKIDDSSSSLYVALNGQTLFYSSVESDSASDGYLVLNVNGDYDHDGGTAHGWSNEPSALEDESWVTLTLDNPFEIFENYHILMEISEDGSAGRSADDTTSDESPSLYYQHTYDKRTLRWFAEKGTGGEDYPFSNAIPDVVPYDNMTFGQRVPMVKFCIFPDACPQAAIVEVTTATDSSDVYGRRLTQSERRQATVEQVAASEKHADAQKERRAAKLAERRLAASEDDPSAWTAATVEVALNGQDFSEVSTAFYVYNDVEMYFDPTDLAPLIGPSTGDTEVRFALPPNFPFYDPGTYYEYQLYGEIEPTDAILVQFALQDAYGGFSGYKEFAEGLLASANDPEYIYVYTPPLLAGKYTVSLSVNGRNYWPISGYTPSQNCTYESSIGRVMGGECVSGESECQGFFEESNFNTALEDCLHCCVTETFFYVYTNFDIALADGTTTIEGFSSGYSPNIDSTGTLDTYDVSVAIGDTTFVDADRVCCFYLAPRNVLTAEVFEAYTDDEDDYADRILNLPPLDYSEFPRQTPDESIWNLCGEPWATLTSSSVITCAAPALPIWVDNTYDWKLRVSINAQNHHGITNTLSEWDGLDGIDYNSKPCPAGYYQQFYQQVCLPCPKGTMDDRTDFTFTTLTECLVCGEGSYQDELAQTECKNCPRTPNELDSFFFSTTMDLEFNVLSGQQSMDACMCQAGYWKNPDPDYECDVPGECCATCPTPGGRCVGGISTQEPQSVSEGGIVGKAIYYDFASGNVSRPYWHNMPFARKGYFRIPSPLEGIIAECSPSPKTDDDGYDSDSGACLGGISIEADSLYTLTDAVGGIVEVGNAIDEQFPNVCAPGYSQTFMCSDCTRDFYKDQGYCMPCPTKNPYLLGLMFVFLVAFLFMFAKYARHLNGLASPRVFYNFGIVTSSFMYFDITWPPEIVTFLEIIDKYIAIDINILKSECEIPNLTFAQVTSITLATPFVLGEMFALLYVSEIFVRKFQTENRMEANDSAAERSKTLLRGLGSMIDELVREVYRQIGLNLVVSLIGPRGILWSALFFVLSETLIPVYLIFTFILKWLNPRLSFPTVRALVDSRLAAFEESSGRLFEFAMWFLTYSLGGIPAVLIAGPLYVLFVAYTFMITIVEMGASDDKISASNKEPSYKTFYSSAMGATNVLFVRWLAVFPLALMLVPLDLIVTTVAYLVKVFKYLGNPPAPVAVSEWPLHVGRASAMVWLPSKFWVWGGTPGSFLSRIVHWFCGHLALFFFTPVAGGMFLVGKIVGAFVWVNTPGHGRRLDRPRTIFMTWRRQAIEFYRKVNGEADATTFNYKDGNLEQLHAVGRAVPWGYIRVRVNQTWLGRLFMNTHRMGKRDEVRQVVSIDPTRPTEPERIHIEEPLVGFPIRNQHYMYMSRKEIDASLEKRFRKPRAEVSTQEVIEALNRTPGDFYIRRDRKREVIEKLTEQVKRENEGETDADREASSKRGRSTSIAQPAYAAYGASQPRASQARGASTGRGRRGSEFSRSSDKKQLATGFGAPPDSITDADAESGEMETIKVKVPKGANPGDTVEFDLPGDRKAKVKIPANAKVGQNLKVKVPKVASSSEPAAATDEADIEEGDSEAVDEEAVPEEDSLAKPIPGEMETIKVKVPKGASPGDTVEFDLPGDRTARVKIPANAKPGHRIKVKVPRLRVPTKGVDLTADGPSGNLDEEDDGDDDFEEDEEAGIQRNFDGRGPSRRRNSIMRQAISKRSTRAVENTDKERALDMLGLLRGSWVNGNGLLSVANPTEMTVLTGNMFKGNFDWWAIRSAAFKRLCCLFYNDVRPNCSLLLGYGDYAGFAWEVRLAFFVVYLMLTAFYPLVFLAVLAITILGQLGFVPNVRLFVKAKAQRSHVLVRLQDISMLDGSSIAAASIAQKKRGGMTLKQHRRAARHWRMAYMKARILQAVVRKYSAKKDHQDRFMKFKSPTMGSEDSMLQRARALGLFESYKGDSNAMRVRIQSLQSGLGSPTSDGSDNKKKSEADAKKDANKHKDGNFQPGIDPRDETYENWLHRTGLTVFAKRRKRETALNNDSVMRRLKNNAWDSAVSFDVDIRTQKFIMSKDGHANENRTAKVAGMFDNDEETKFAQQFQDSSVTINFETRVSPVTKLPELVSTVHFSDAECAVAWKRAIELEMSNPDSHVRGYQVKWRSSLLGHFSKVVGVTVFYLILMPMVLAITILMFVWRHLCISFMNTWRRWRRRYERVSFATIQRRQQGKGKTGRAMIHDAMDRYTFQTSWLRDVDSVDDRVAIAQAAQDGSRSGSTFFVEKALQHSLTTYITTFPERNAALKLYRNTVSQLGDFAENHEPVDVNEFNPRRIANKYVNAFIMLLSFAHVTLSLTVLELIDCSVQPGLNYETLDKDPSIRCHDSAEHQSLMRIFYVFAPAYIIGIPFLIMGLVYSQVILPGLRNEAEAKVRYGYFYAKYNPDTWWWELTFMLRKLAVPAIKMFTDNLVVLVQITSAFLLFLLFALWQNLAKPFIEEGCNFCDTLALSAHVFVMFAGAMYQTGRLQTELASSYAYLFIFVNTYVGLYLFNYARSEVVQCLPLIGMILSSEFWLNYAWPYVFWTVRYRLFGSRHKQHYIEAQDKFFMYYYSHDEDDYRANMADRLRRQPLLSDIGRAKAKQWIRDYSSTMRDGLLYNEYLNQCKAEINRSVFVYMVTSPKYNHTNQFEYGKYDKWLSSFGASIRIMRKHINNDTRLLRHYNVGRSVVGRDSYATIVSMGSVDVLKLLEPHVPQRNQRGRRRQHDNEYRPYVDFDGSGNFYLCFINRVTSTAEISVSLTETKAPPHFVLDFHSGKERIAELPSPHEAFTVSVQNLRIYSRVGIKDYDGETWPGEITRAQPDGMYRVRDPIHGDYAFPVGRGDLSRMGAPMNHSLGYVWHSFCEEEDRKEYSALNREDLEVYVHSTEAIASETIPCKTQIEWLQSRLVLAPASVGGRDSSSWVSTGYADGTVDIWSSLNGAKMFTLQHGEPVTFTYVTPSGNVVISLSGNYLVYWDIPKDRDLGQPARLPNRDPWNSRFFQAESLNLDLFDLDEREASEYILPEELQDSTIIAVGNSTAVGDTTSIWMVAVNEENVLLYGVSQRKGFMRAQAWPQPSDDHVVAAEICGQNKKAEVASQAASYLDKQKAAIAEKKKALGGKAAAAAPAAAKSDKKEKTDAKRTAKEAPTQILVLTTQSGNFFTVHVGGFPISAAFHSQRKKALEAMQAAKKTAAESGKRGKSKGRNEKDEEAMRTGNVKAGAHRKSIVGGLGSVLAARSKEKGDVWDHGGTVLQKVLPEREREQRMTQVDKIEAQIQALWREHNAEPRFQNGNHPERSSNTSDRLEDEIKLLRRKLIDMNLGVMRDRYTTAIDLMVKKKEYLDKHDVDTKVIDSFVCGETMRAVLLLQEDPINRRNASSRWYMRLVDLRRDPRVSAREVAPRHLFSKVDDSCDLTEKWPRSDPAFFDNAAVCMLARSLTREVNGYEGSFSYMSSKKFFESTLDIAFDHMVEEKRNLRLAQTANDLFSASSHRLLVEMASFGGSEDNDEMSALQALSSYFNGDSNDVGRVKILSAVLRPATLGIVLGNRDPAQLLFVESTVDESGVISALAVEEGDRVVSANGDASFAKMDSDTAHAALQGLLRAGPLLMEFERPGEGMFEASMNDGPLNGLKFESVEGLLIIKMVVKRGPAAMAGLQRGDRVVSVNDDSSFAMKSVVDATASLARLMEQPPYSASVKVLRAAREPGDDDDDDDDDDAQAVEIAAPKKSITTLFRKDKGKKGEETGEMEVFKVRVPAGGKPGDTIEFKLPGDRSAKIKLPPNCKPNQLIEVKAPKIAPKTDPSKDGAATVGADTAATEEKESEAKDEEEKTPEQEEAGGSLLGDISNTGGMGLNMAAAGFGSLFGGGSGAASTTEAEANAAEPAPAPSTSTLGGGISSLLRGSSKSPPKTRPNTADAESVASESAHQYKADELEVVKVKVPASAAAGDTVEFQLPGDRSAKIKIPAGAKPGQVIKVKVPTVAAYENKKKLEAAEQASSGEASIESDQKDAAAAAAAAAGVKVAPKASPETADAISSLRQYEVVFRDERLGISLLDNGHELPSVDENTRQPADPLPYEGDFLVKVNGESLIGADEPYERAVEIITTKGRPVTLTFATSKKEADAATASEKPSVVAAPGVTESKEGDSKAPEPKAEGSAKDSDPKAVGSKEAESKGADAQDAPKEVAASSDKKASADDDKLSSFGIAGAQSKSTAAAGGWNTTATSGKTEEAEEITKAPETVQNGLLGLFGLEVTDDGIKDPDAGASKTEEGGEGGEEGSMFGSMLSASAVSSGVERLGRSLSFTERDPAAAGADGTTAAAEGEQSSVVGSMANMMGGTAPNFSSLFGDATTPAIEAPPAESTASPAEGKEVQNKEKGWGFGW